MRPIVITLAFPDNAPVHRVMQILREAGKQPSIVKPTLTIVSGEQADAEGLAQQLRRVGVSVQIHPSLAPAGDGSQVEANPSSRPVILHGTDNLPAHVEINGDSYPLGDIVRKAHALSGMSAEAWNRLPQHTRDDYIETALEAIRTQDPTAPQHEITADEFAAALQQRQKDAQADAGGALEQEKDDPVTASLMETIAVSIDSADSEAIGPPPYDLGVGDAAAQVSEKFDAPTLSTDSGATSEQVIVQQLELSHAAHSGEVLEGEKGERSTAEFSKELEQIAADTYVSGDGLPPGVTAEDIAETADSVHAAAEQKSE